MFLLVAFAVNSHIICGRIFYVGRNLKMNRMLLIQVLLLFLCGCGDSWQATVYPNKNNLKDYKHLGEFTSIDECRRSCLGYLEDIHSLNKGDYECGKNCKYNSGDDMYVCEETLK